MYNFDNVHRVIFEELGEGGLEALHDCICFALSNAASEFWGCEEDKLISLMFLFSCPVGGYIEPDINPTHNFLLDFTKPIGFVRSSVSDS